MRGESGQAITEYTLIMLVMLGGLLGGSWLAQKNPTFMNAWVGLFNVLSQMADSYDFVLSLPIP